MRTARFWCHKLIWYFADQSVGWASKPVFVPTISCACVDSWKSQFWSRTLHSSAKCMAIWAVKMKASPWRLEYVSLCWTLHNFLVYKCLKIGLNQHNDHAIMHVFLNFVAKQTATIYSPLPPFFGKCRKTSMPCLSTNKASESPRGFLICLQASFALNIP